MKTHKRIAAISGVLTILVIACAVLGIVLYKTRDRRAVDRAVRRLAEDIEIRQSETADHTAWLDAACELVYGDASAEYSVNIGGIDIADMLSKERISEFSKSAGIYLDDEDYRFINGADNITIGLDGEINRACGDKEMSVSADVSVMHYSFADVRAYVHGHRAYISVPGVYDGVFDIDAELFPKRGSVSLSDIWDDISDSAQYLDIIKDIRRDMTIVRDDDPREIAAIDTDEEAYECSVYHITIDCGQIQALTDRITGDSVVIWGGDDIALTVYVDEYHDIRYIAADSPLEIGNGRIDLSAQLRGREYPMDDTEVSMYDHTSGFGLDMYIGRRIYDTNIGYRIRAGAGVYDLSGEIIPEYDTNTNKDKDEYSLTYKGLSLAYNGQTLVRSSGHITIAAGSADVDRLP